MQMFNNYSTTESLHMLQFIVAQMGGGGTTPKQYNNITAAGS